ncbi:hypothetical protein AK812_SmicGene19681 [Symbiodinium microadriaticum]|uniref:Uncharacterized protein n=1 Tax=Symbiodinium microadriaticum TaxID=2951 RepID=A0A1Q9DRX2_SYMMI|nr:hypothetical protein AK812_SmicGene19681 [Symbiodinium microadriaticum]
MLAPLKPGDHAAVRGAEFQIIRADDQAIVHSMSFDAESADLIPMLHILMDQGPIGCAANAFSLDQCLLVHYSYDKIHRLHRDIKGPLRGSLGSTAAADNLSEFAASRMVLEWYLGLGTDQSPDDIDQPQLCFKEAAGLKLCYLGHSWVTWENAHVIARLQEPCWDYYSRQLHEIKTVEDSLTETQSMRTGWSQHWSLTATANILVFEEHWHDLVCPGSRSLNNS